MGKLFGTDGIRGRADRYPMTSEVAERVGGAVADLFGQQGHKATILIGKDTRISGETLEQALISGICSRGGDVLLAGVLPTPGVAYITRHLDLDGGVVVSASHNPFHDNGIKIIRRDGFKLSDDIEGEIEGRILGDSDSRLDKSRRLASSGSVRPFPRAKSGYLSFLKQAVFEGEALKGLQLVLDCANGATYEVAPLAFTGLGAAVRTLCAEPDGRNINFNCGSEYPQEVAREVVRAKADAGFAFDGDGDRVIAVDEKGGILTGDQMLTICAKALKDEDRLKNNLVVSTLMSNMGLGLALRELGIDHLMTRVGDRNVVEAMVARGACLGGEDSGHMIFLEHHTTGDGILTALWLLRAMKRAKKPLSELCGLMTVYPQRLLNVEVKSKPPIGTVPAIVSVIHRVEDALGDRGRVLVRYSGTQPMCRVMVEAPSGKDSEQFCREIAAVVEQKLG